MTDKDATCHMLTALRATLHEQGIPTIRGNRIRAQTTKLIVIEAYAEAVSDVIDAGNFDASVNGIGHGLSTITQYTQ